MVRGPGAAPADVAELVDGDDDRRDGQFDVHPVQHGVHPGSEPFEDLTGQPRRIAQRVVGELDVLVEHLRPGPRGQLEPGVADLDGEHEQHTQGDAAQRTSPGPPCNATAAYPASSTSTIVARSPPSGVHR